MKTNHNDILINIKLSFGKRYVPSGGGFCLFEQMKQCYEFKYISSLQNKAGSKSSVPGRRPGTCLCCCSSPALSEACTSLTAVQRYAQIPAARHCRKLRWGDNDLVQLFTLMFFITRKRKLIRRYNLVSRCLLSRI